MNVAPASLDSAPYRFAEIEAADPRRWVFLARDCEEVDALLAAGSLATCPPPDCAGWIEDDFAEPLRGRRVAILGRDDEFGRLESAKLAKALWDSVQEVRIIEPPGLTPRQSVVEWLQTGFTVDHLHACVELAPPWPPMAAAASAPAPEEGCSGFSGSPPQPRPIRGDLRPVPTMDERLIPEPFRGWLKDIAERASCPLDLPVMAALVSVGAVVGRKVGIRPKRYDDWTVVPNLWGMGVCHPT
jgi:hypothetical protein